MAVELATAYISLVSDTSKLAPSITKGTSGLGTTLEKSGKGLGGSLMKGIGGAAVVGAAAVGAAAVGTLGVALTKGFARLNSLEQATAKLEGLGHSAESVQSIMDNALAAVRGTAFGMDEAASVAAGVVAAGVKPGQELERTLKLVADASTIAGTSMGDMGAIFNKVAGTGKIQGEVIAQLGERGIPILQLLADEMGVSAEEVGKLASAGEIDFARFQNAMESGMGGAALKSGETFQGALANVNASLGRIGAGLLGGVFPMLAPMFQSLLDVMAPLEEKAKVVGAGIGGLVTLIKDGDFSSVLSDSFGWEEDSPIVDFILTLRDALGNIDFSPFLELAGYLSPIGLAFKVLAPLLPQIMSTLGEVAGVIGGALQQVLVALMPVFSQLVGVFTSLLSQILPPLLPIIVQLAGIISQVLLAVLPLIAPLMQLIEAIFPILQTVIAALIPIIQGVVDAIGAVLIPVVDTLVAVLGGVITFLTGVFTGDWEKAWQGVQEIFSGLWNGILDIGKGVINGMIDLINGFLGGLNEVGNFVADVTGGAVDFNIGTIPHLAEGATVLPRRGGTLAVLAEAGRAESVVDTGLLNRALRDGISGSGSSGGPQVQVDATFQQMDPDVAIRRMSEDVSFALGGR